MKSRLAQGLVRWVSRWINASYQANHDGYPRMERFFSAGANHVQSFALPIAKRLDQDAMTQQMAKEGWWG